MADPVKDLASKLIKVGAPILGGIVGGPVGALIPVVVGALAEALGADPTPEAIGAALESNPNAKVIVQRVETNQGTGLTQLEAELLDIQNARATTVKLAEGGSNIAWGAPIVSFMIVGGFLSMVGALLFKHIPDNNVTMVLLGALSTAFAQVTNYWLGSSAGSARQGDTVRQIALGKSKP